MSREIFYEYSASAVPPDPTVNSTKYVAPLAFANGYYKAIARENGDLSLVTSVSFGVSPTDYIHYYPLTADFNDHAGSNNLTNSNCTVDANGCLIDSKSDYMLTSTAIGSSIVSVSMIYRFDGTGAKYNTFLNSNNIQYHHLFTDSVGKIGVYANGFYYSNFTMQIGETYRIVLMMNGTNEFLYVNGQLQFTWSLGWNNSIVPINIIGNTSSADQGLLGLIKEIKIFNRVLSESEIGSL